MNVDRTSGLEMCDCTVVIPTYNRLSTIERSIDSVLAQTILPAEIIVVDDGSTDETEEVLKRYKNLITYVKQNNSGANVARNLGWDMSKTAWVAFQDSDDFWLPSKLATFFRILDSSQDGIDRFKVTFSGYFTVNNSDGEYRYRPGVNRIATGYYDQPIKDLGLIRRNVVSTQTLIVHKSVKHAGYRFDESMPRFQDWEFALSLGQEYGFYYLDQPLVIVYEQPISITANSSSGVIAKERILNKHRQLLMSFKLDWFLFFVKYALQKLHAGFRNFIG